MTKGLPSARAGHHRTPHGFSSRHTDPWVFATKVETSFPFQPLPQLYVLVSLKFNPVIPASKTLRFYQLGSISKVGAPLKQNNFF